MFVVIGGPADRRVALFQAALAGLDLPPARVVGYAALLAGQIRLDEVVRPGDVVRIESPGKDGALERLLIAAAGPEPEPGFDHYAPAELDRLPLEPGRILSSRQWYRGFVATLGRISDQLALCPPHCLMNHPADIAAMFDKPACHSRLSAAGVAVPPALGPVGSHAELIDSMAAAGMARVFIKPAHGSSASGVVAYQQQGTRQQATTTVEMIGHDGQTRLYNSRRLRTYRDSSEIARLIDALCRQRVHVERWLPKAGIAGHIFDLRVVVIAGNARHAVVRMSRGPITNLHLLNPRGDLAAVRDLLRPAAWAAAMHTCEAAAACFPDSLYAGVDLLIARDLRAHAVLEVNAFGDLLPGVLCAGRDTYAAEILAMEEILCSTPAR